MPLQVHVCNGLTRPVNESMLALKRTRPPASGCIHRPT